MASEEGGPEAEPRHWRQVGPGLAHQAGLPPQFAIRPLHTRDGDRARAAPRACGPPTEPSCRATTRSPSTRRRATCCGSKSPWPGLDYLPLTYTQVGPPPALGNLALDQPGTFAWRWADQPAQLMSLWTQGTTNEITKAAIEAFENENNLGVDGEAGPGGVDGADQRHHQPQDQPGALRLRAGQQGRAAEPHAVPGRSGQVRRHPGELRRARGRHHRRQLRRSSSTCATRT